MTNNSNQTVRKNSTLRSDKSRIKKITPANSSKLRSLTRLIIGATALGADTLIYRLNEWEKSLSQTTIYNDNDPSPRIMKGDNIETPKPSLQKYHSSTSRQALIGFIFAAQDRIRSGSTLLNRGARLIGKISDPLVTPIKELRIFTPVRSQYRNLVARGESQVNRWIEVGRAEGVYSRKLAQTALDDTVDMSLEYMADNSEVQELIQAQGTGLAFELIEEVRERTVSGDTYLEGVLRSLLWRTPRSNLPGPTGEVRSRAISLRTSNITKDQDNIGTNTSN